MTTTTSLVDEGNPVACSGGDTSRPSQVCARGIVAPGFKSLVTAIEALNPDPPDGGVDVVDGLLEPPPQPATPKAATSTAKNARAERIDELSGEQSRDARTRFGALSRYAIQDRGRRGLVIGYGLVHESAIGQAIAALGRAIGPWLEAIT